MRIAAAHQHTSNKFWVAKASDSISKIAAHPKCPYRALVLTTSLPKSAPEPPVKNWERPFAENSEPPEAAVHCGDTIFLSGKRQCGLLPLASRGCTSAPCQKNGTSSALRRYCSRGRSSRYCRGHVVAVPIGLGTDASNQEVDEGAHLRRQVPGRQIHRIDVALDRDVLRAPPATSQPASPCQ